MNFISRAKEADKYVPADDSLCYSSRWPDDQVGTYRDSGCIRS